MTKKKDTGKNKKPRNQTAHRRAMASPQVQDAIIALRDGWDSLSPEQRGKQLNELIGLKCSVRGIADDSGIPESSIRRNMLLANPSEPGSDWIAMMKSTLAKEPEEENPISALEAARQSRATFQSLKKEAPNKEKCPTQDHAQPSKAPQTNKLIASSSKRAEDPLPVIDAVTGQEDRAGQDAPRPSLLEQYKLGHPSRSERIRQLAAMPGLTYSRPYRDARSMKRQGKPLPPTD